jgi:hypothetical protein
MYTHTYIHIHGWKERCMDASASAVRVVVSLNWSTRRLACPWRSSHRTYVAISVVKITQQKVGLESSFVRKLTDVTASRPRGITTQIPVRRYILNTFDRSKHNINLQNLIYMFTGTYVYNLLHSLSTNAHTHMSI